MESGQSEVTASYRKYKKGIWISTGVFALIGLAGGIFGAILFASFGFFITYILTIILFMIKETPEEREYFREQRKKLNAEREEERQKLKERKIQNKLVERKKKEEEQRKKEEAEREQEELYKKQVEQWQTEDLSKYATKLSELKLKKAEYAIYSPNSQITWSESRSRTKRINYGGFTSTIHIAKGLNYRIGSIRTAFQKEEYMKQIVTGTLALTNKRIIVTNGTEAKSYLFTRLLRMVPYDDGVELISDSGKKVILSGFNDATRFNIYLDRLTSDDDIISNNISTTNQDRAAIDTKQKNQVVTSNSTPSIEEVPEESSETDNDSSLQHLETVYLEKDFSIGDLLFLNWINGREKAQIAPADFVTSFSVNPLTETQKLVEKKLIGDASLEMRLSKLRVKELKKVLRENDQKVSGRKLELIDRIIQNIDSDIYIDSLPQVYELTDKGHSLVKKYRLLIWAHNNNRLIPTEEYIPYIGSNEVPQNIAIKLVSNKLNYEIKKNNKYNAFVYKQCEDSLAEFYLELEDNEHYVQHSIVTFLLDYFLIDESYTDIYFEPRDYNTAYLQTQLIKTNQISELNTNVISDSISYFITTYKSVLPKYVLNSENEMSRAINNALTLSPEVFHNERLNFLKKHIRMQQLNFN